MNKIFFIYLFFFLNILSAQIAFEDVANEKGVGYSYGDSEYGGGVSFADFDNDGWDDITYASEDGVELYDHESYTHAPRLWFAYAKPCRVLAARTADAGVYGH